MKQMLKFKGMLEHFTRSFAQKNMHQHTIAKFKIKRKVRRGAVASRSWGGEDYLRAEGNIMGLDAEFIISLRGYYVFIESIKLLFPKLPTGEL